MFMEERQEKIVEFVEQNGRIATTTIQEMFHVSFDTARRDIRILDEKGLIRKIRGGALPIRSVGYGKGKKCSAKDFSVIYENYYQIAMKAISFISENDVIYITGGTIGFIMAQNMPANIKITVVVNSVVIAEELRKYDNITVVIAGGTMDARGNCYDAFALETINNIRIDKCFFTSACVSVEFGLSIQSSNGIELFKRVLNNSNVVIGLYPTEKVGINATLKICSVTILNKIILDWYVEEKEENNFRDVGIEVILVEENEYTKQT